MSSVSESGHAKNVANLQKLIQTINTFGVNYNPSNTNITTTALSALYTNATTLLDAVTTNLQIWKDATNTREIAFKACTTISTQLLSTLQSFDVSQQTIDDFSALVKKMRGDSSSKPTKAEAEKLTANDTASAESTSNSTSQQSFDNKIQHFGKMITSLQNQTNYTPNETAFQVVTLQADLANLKSINTAANNAKANLTSSRIDRNKLFYGDTNNLLDVVKRTKNYIKGLYGASSQQYKSVLAIKFIRVIEKKKAN